MIKPTNDELWRLRRDFSPRRLLDDPDGIGVDEGWRMTLDNMTKIISTVRAASLPMVIICAPYEDQLSLFPPKAPSPQDVLAAFAQENGIPFLDLLPVFRNYVAEHRVKPSALFWDPLHFTAVGHDVAAVAIFNFLERQGWLD